MTFQRACPVGLFLLGAALPLSASAQVAPTGEALPPTQVVIAPAPGAVVQAAPQGIPNGPVYVAPGQSVYIAPSPPPGQAPLYIAPPPPQAVAPMPMQVPPPLYATQLPPSRALLGYKTERRHGLIIAGSVVLGVTYLITAGTAMLFDTVCNAASSCHQTTWPLYVPVAGPFIQTAFVERSVVTPLAVGGLVFAGLAQSAGFAMLIGGIANPRRVPVYAQRMQVAPTFGTGGGGIAVAGTF